VAKALSAEKPTTASRPGTNRSRKGITVTANEAKGGALVTVKDESGKATVARAIPSDEPAGKLLHLPAPKRFASRALSCGG